MLEPNFSGGSVEFWTAAARGAKASLGRAMRAQETGGARRLGQRLGPLLLGASAALASLLALWGFTVDDALITARVAASLAAGGGHRFNPGGPPVDAVTPLGFAHVLSPFASAGPLGAFAAARWLGAVAWVAAAGLLGVMIARRGRRTVRFLPLAWIAVSAPLGAWASAGMETGLVVAMATLALAQHRLAPLAAGLAAAWRPELLPWAMLLGVGTSLARSARPGPAIAGWALAVTPALGVGLARAVAFGTAMPLAVLAKPASLKDGLGYAVAAALWTGAPWLVVAPRALRTLGRHELALLVAAAAHFPVLALAGGDWMPLFRLVVPVLPTFVLVGAAVAERASLPPTLARSALALGLSLHLAWELGPASRGVFRQRAELVANARPKLAGARAVACLDAGWVGVATSAEVVDLAGVTDPRIARLPGGHTSKRLPQELLESRGVDAVLALRDDQAGSWFRQNDARLAELAELKGFAEAAELPLRGSRFRYVLFLPGHRPERP